MTAFNPADIPASVDTIEKLVTWGSLVLNVINPTQTVNEGPGSPAKVAQFGVFKVDETNKSHIFVRLTMSLDDTYAYHNGPLWEVVSNFSTDSIPSSLTA